MAWTSQQGTQNGNTTVTWTVGPHSSLSTHDAVVVKPEAGNSGLQIEHITVNRNPTTYAVRLRVAGSGAMSFRFAAEQMD